MKNKKIINRYPSLFFRYPSKELKFHIKIELKSPICGHKKTMVVFFPDAVSSDRTNPRKTSAWNIIFEGMPTTSVERVKKCWFAAKTKHTGQLKSSNHHKKLSPLSKAIMNILNDINSNNIQYIIPKVSCFYNCSMLIFGQQ